MSQTTTENGAVLIGSCHSHGLYALYSDGLLIGYGWNDSYETNSLHGFWSAPADREAAEEYADGLDMTPDWPD